MLGHRGIPTAAKLPQVVDYGQHWCHPQLRERLYRLQLAAGMRHQQAHAHLHCGMKLHDGL